MAGSWFCIEQEQFADMRVLKITDKNNSGE